MQGKPIYEFGAFRLDPQERLLLYEGRKVSLRAKLFNLLVILVENSGHLLTNKELKTKAWAEPFVSEKTIQVTVGELRKLLGEGLNGEHYIENIHGEGYRFIAPVSRIENPVPAQEPPDAEAVKPSSAPSSASQQESQVTVFQRPRAPRRAWLRTGFAIAVLAVVAASVGFFVVSSPPPVVTGYTPLTDAGHPIGDFLLTDGVRVYFQEQIGDKQFLAAVSASGSGAPVYVSTPFKTPVLEGMFPGGESLLVSDGWPQGTLWRLPLPSGSPQPVGKMDGSIAMSPDGRRFAQMEGGRALAVAEMDGSGFRRIYSSARSIVYLWSWSPDSRRLCFTQLDPEAGNGADLFSIWSIDADGSNLRNLVSPKAGAEGFAFCNWTPDARYLLYSAGTNGKADLWAIRDQPAWLRFAHPKPVRLTNNPVEFFAPASSPDGKKIFALGKLQRGELERYDQQTRALLPFMNGMSVATLDFSRDGQWVTYVKFPENTLWRSRLDGSDSRQLTFAPFLADSPHWSPDGTRIAYRSGLHGKPQEISVISCDGGVSQQLIPGDQQEEGVPTWSPDGKYLTFGRLRYQPDKIDISIMDLQTGQIKTVPGSKGLWSPRWSPHGRYLMALSANPVSFLSKSLLVFDFQTNQWKKLLDDGAIEEPVWSHDDQYIYLVTNTSEADRALLRVRISDAKLERIMGLAGFPHLGTWLGLTPDDAPLMLRDVRQTEIYALDVRW
jgi:Tol biopolymer transport system component/DNA-binding winged helix-turn-helix (wHTH) protein